jgi:protein TonB
MNGVAANPAQSLDIRLKPFLTISGICHAGLIVLMAVSGYLHFFRGNQWDAAGGGSNAVKVTLVNGNTGMPLPHDASVNDSAVVDPSKSLWKTDIKPEPPKPQEQKIEPPDLKQVQEFKTLEKFNKKPAPPPHKSRVFEPKMKNPDNAIPGHNYGSPNLPTGPSTVPGTSPNQGTALQGQGGSDFGAKFPWYVEAMKRRISQNWLQNTIDPTVRAARRAKTTVTFRIYKDGTVKDLQITQSSGNQSMDNSAMRAMLNANNMPALPNEYSGTYVEVTFDFDLAMTQ